MWAVFCAALPVPGTHLHAPARRQIGPDARRVAPTAAPRQRGPGRAQRWLFGRRRLCACSVLGFVICSTARPPWPVHQCWKHPAPSTGAVPVVWIHSCHVHPLPFAAQKLSVTLSLPDTHSPRSYSPSACDDGSVRTNISQASGTSSFRSQPFLSHQLVPRLQKTTYWRG